mmetsp:Transcript_6783/g.18959  ORF Transcript_6783/g.18959 Transcript_6783/m.18959 type:complete len:637 (-) Transcript_6783:946-2856(-)
MSNKKQLASRSSESSGAERKAKKSKESFHFPGRHQNGAANVYRSIHGYRDNSSFLAELFSSNDAAICFTRPMQLGKTTLFSLADEVFSINKESNVDTDLNFSPGGENRNKWYVLRLDFGAVCPARFKKNEAEEEWVQLCRELDKQTGHSIKQRVIFLLMNNPHLHENFKAISQGVEIKDQSIGLMIESLGNAIQFEKGRLLILVDEYDQPVREGLLRLIPFHGKQLYESAEHQIKSSFQNYFSFFRAVKVLLEIVSPSKIWLTGITPIGIKEMSGLNIAVVTFKANMADAVGLTENDVKGMLYDVHKYAPFEDGQLEFAMDSLKRNFNNLRFPHSQPLYHTALVNGIMNMLLDPTDPTKRREFLSTGKVPSDLAREPVPSSIFNVLRNAKNLRHVVNVLAERGQISGPGFKINEQLSLEHLLQETINVSDYLTLLVHIGVVSASGTATANPTFAMTSECYRENLLKPILKTLRASLVKLVSLTSKEDLYAQGEEILVDFVTSISKNNMTKLMAWASSDTNNHILELQFQSHVVTEAHDILDGKARTSQEDNLPKTGKRTDVTFSSETCVVILELKQVASEAPPTAAFISKAHEQLAGYVETRQLMEIAGKGRPVAGFVVVMHNDGAAYIVEKLRQD